MPVTLFAFLFHVFPCWMLGWYKFIGWRDRAWVWTHGSKMPNFLLNLWGDWLGHTLGTTVVIKHDPSDNEMSARILIHELEHARQGMVFGPFLPFVYAFFYVITRLFIDKAHGYYDSPLEIAARRAAGQYVDIWGAVLKLKK